MRERLVVATAADPGPLSNDEVDCVSARRLGDDQLEIAVLTDVLGKNASGRGSRVVNIGFDGSCATEAQAVVDQAVLDQFLTEEQVPIVDCLTSISDDEMQPFVMIDDLFGLVDVVTERCN